MYTRNAESIPRATSHIFTTVALIADLFLDMLTSILNAQVLISFVVAVQTLHFRLKRTCFTNRRLRTANVKNL